MILLAVSAPPSVAPASQESAAASCVPLLGLSSPEAARRLGTSGPNEIRRERPRSPLTLFAQQFASPVVWLRRGGSTIGAWW